MDPSAALLTAPAPSDPIAIITSFQDTTSSMVRNAWEEFFYRIVSTYRDMYQVVNPHAENFLHATAYLTVDKLFMEQMGFWGKPGTAPAGEQPIPVKPINVSDSAACVLYVLCGTAGYVLCVCSVVVLLAVSCMCSVCARVLSVRPKQLTMRWDSYRRHCSLV